MFTERPEGRVEKAPQYMTEPSLVANIDKLMENLATSDTFEQAKSKLESFVQTEVRKTRNGLVTIVRIQLSKALLDYEERYKILNETQWRRSRTKSLSPCSNGVVFFGVFGFLYQPTAPNFGFGHRICDS